MHHYVRLKNVVTIVSAMFSLNLLFWKIESYKLYKNLENIKLFVGNDGLLLFGYFDQYFYFLFSLAIAGITWYLKQIYINKHNNIYINLSIIVKHVRLFVFILIATYLLLFTLNYYLNWNISIFFYIGNEIISKLPIHYFFICYFASYGLFELDGHSKGV